MASVSAVVVNYNAGPALNRCVLSLLAGTLKPPVTVIDNASTDGSAEVLRNQYGNHAGVEILSNVRNLGFARAVNFAVKAAVSDLVLVLNPDCRVGADTVELLQKALEDDPEAGLAGPCVRDGEGNLEKATLRRFPDPWNALMTFSGLWRLGRWVPLFRGVPVSRAEIPRNTVRAEAVSGACMMIRRDAFIDIGMMDEGYGLHCEDLDLMYRLQQSGRHCLFVPSAGAVHEQGVSSSSRPMWVHRQKHLGMARFYRKFQARNHIFPVRWLVFTGIWLHYLLLWPWVARSK
jgi:GT2 family glycosyltransferase